MFSLSAKTQEEQGKILKELGEFCKNTLKLLEERLLPNARNDKDAEAEVDYSKLRGDLYMIWGDSSDSNW